MNLKKLAIGEDDFKLFRVGNRSCGHYFRWKKGMGEEAIIKVIVNVINLLDNDRYRCV
jgi:hypothetical protein